MGFGLALAQNEAALRRFSALNDARRRQLLSGLGGISSPQEMKDYVQRFAEGQIV